jgi:hypothetical protein
MPVTEHETTEAVMLLPENSWLRTYVIHGLKQTTAPLVYHLGTGLAVLGTTCPVAYGTHYAGTLRANNFALLVGRSGEDNKSTALNVGTQLLLAAAPELCGDFPGSPEGLVESLADQESQFISVSEFGKLLSSAQRGYFEPIKTMLADVWDSLPIQRAKAAQRGQRLVIRAENPRLSIGAACSIPYLEKHTLAEDWTGGFMGRWMVFYGRRERTEPNPVGDDTHVAFLLEELRRRATTETAGWCTGLDAAASRMWDEWYNDVSARILPNNIIGIRARAPTICRKIALVLGWDYGAALAGQPWEVGLDIMIPAIAITELHIKSLIHLSAMIAEHGDARLRRSVIEAVESQGGISTLGQILGVMKMRKRIIQEMLDSLIEEGRIKRVQTTSGPAFELQE